MTEEKFFFTEERILSLGGFLILCAVTTFSFIIPAETKTIIPNPNLTIPIIDMISAAGAFFSFLFPKKRLVTYITLLIQGILSLLCGYGTLGVFLLTALIILAFCNGDLRTKIVPKLTVYFLVWFISLLGTLSFGIHKFILTLIESLFFVSFYFCIYRKLAVLLKPISPVLKNIDNSKIQWPEIGKTIYLCDFDLNTRQQNFIYDNLKLKSSYNDLSEKYFVSPSTVKKEMVDAFNKVGVKNLEELRLLLTQYDVQLERSNSTGIFN